MNPQTKLHNARGKICKLCDRKFWMQKMLDKQIEGMNANKKAIDAMKEQ